MEYRTPKVLEKKPVVGSFDLQTAIIIVICTLAAVFTLFVSFLMSLVFIAIAVIYLRLNSRYPRKGELNQLLKYNSSLKCIRINQEIKSLIKRR